MPKCQKACGECCNYWIEVYTKTPSYFRGVKDPSKHDDCPNLGPTGCKLPRERRPAACNRYLCFEAFVEKKINMNRKAKQCNHENVRSAGDNGSQRFYWCVDCGTLNIKESLGSAWIRPKNFYKKPKGAKR
jgi:hypothetical protein